MRKKDIDRLQSMIVLIVIIGVISAILGIPNEIAEQITYWLISIFIGILLSGMAGLLVEAFTGDILKGILIPIEIKGIKFSISAFFIVTFIVKILLFGF